MSELVALSFDLVFALPCLGSSGLVSGSSHVIDLDNLVLYAVALHTGDCSDE